MSRTLAARTAWVSFLAAALLLPGACSRIKSKVKGFSENTKAKLAKLKNEDKSKSRYLSIAAKKREDNASAGAPFPYDLHGAFRVELSFGLFTSKRVENLGDGTFGLRVTNVERPGELYEVVARYQTAPAGLQVFANNRDGTQGTPLFFPVDRIDAAAESDGASITLSARPADGISPYSTIATVPLLSAGTPHHAGFAVTGIADRSQVGFTNLTVPFNSTPLGYIARTALGRAVEGVFLEGIRSLFTVLRLANNGVPSTNDIAGIQSNLAAAQLSIRNAMDLAAGLDEGPASRVVASEMSKIDRDLGRLANRIDPSNPKSTGNAVTSSLTGKLPGRVQKVLDALSEVGPARPPAGFDLFVSGGWFLINNSGKRFDIIDVIIEVTTVTLTSLGQEGEEVNEPGEPFTVRYREEAPEIYNDRKDNYEDRVFPGDYFGITDFVNFGRPPGVIRVRHQGRITVKTTKFKTFSLPYDFTF